MFKNPSLVLLLLFSSSLVPKFHFQLTKKKELERRPGKGQHSTIWQMASQL